MSVSSEQDALPAEDVPTIAIAVATLLVLVKLKEVPEPMVIVAGG